MVYILHMMYITLTGRGGGNASQEIMLYHLYKLSNKKRLTTWHTCRTWISRAICQSILLVCAVICSVEAYKAALINFSSRSIKYSFMRGSSLAWAYGSWIYNYLYAISAYHHWCCGLESLSGRGVQHYVIKFVSDLRQVSGFLRFPPPIKLTATI